MKCELAAALVHGPKVLFLDEPTIGLDVSMQSVVRAFIKSYSERHRATVLLTSHHMEDVAALSPRVLVIDHGKLTFDGGLGDLVRKTRPDKLITLSFSAPVAPERLAEVVGATDRELAAARGARARGGRHEGRRRAGASRSCRSSI